MNQFKQTILGIGLTLIISLLAIIISPLILGDVLGPSVLALLIGMLLNPLYIKNESFHFGVNFVTRKVLKLGIIFMGITLSFSQVMLVGRYALILMVFTLTTSFGSGSILGRLFKANWKLSSMLSASTAICGGTAVATLGPAIEADDKDIAYAISATFIFDILTVILFPGFGKALSMSDTSYGLWIGTAVNDTSSVVAAGYAFSEIAGNYAVIVKLTRTLFIVPIVLIFSYVHAKKKASVSKSTVKKIKITDIFPWFILVFLSMVTLKSMNILPDIMVQMFAQTSKLFMVMALAAIGLKTNFNEVKGIGWKPMALGVCIDSIVVVVALLAQGLIQRFF